MTPNLINHFKALSNRALGKLFYVICNKPTLTFTFSNVFVWLVSLPKISLIPMKNNGPRINLYSTPTSISNHVDSWPFNTTKNCPCFRSKNYVERELGF